MKESRNSLDFPDLKEGSFSLSNVIRSLVDANTLPADVKVILADGEMAVAEKLLTSHCEALSTAINHSLEDHARPAPNAEGSLPERTVKQGERAVKEEEREEQALDDNATVEDISVGNKRRKTAQSSRNEQAVEESISGPRGETSRVLTLPQVS